MEVLFGNVVYVSYIKVWTIIDNKTRDLSVLYMPRKVLYIYILSLVETNFKANYYNIKLLGDGYFKSFLISGSLIHLMSSNVVWIIFSVVFTFNVSNFKQILSCYLLLPIKITFWQNNMRYHGIRWYGFRETKYVCNEYHKIPFYIYLRGVLEFRFISLKIRNKINMVSLEL